MSKILDGTAKAQDALIDAVTQVQDVVVSAVGTVSDFVGGFIPELPTKRVSTYVPSPKEIVDQTFSFATRVLEQQKDYTANLLSALEPLTGKVIGNGKPKRKAPAKTTAA